MELSTRLLFPQSVEYLPEIHFHFNVFSLFTKLWTNIELTTIIITNIYHCDSFFIKHSEQSTCKHIISAHQAYMGGQLNAYKMEKVGNTPKKWKHKCYWTLFKLDDKGNITSKEFDKGTGPYNTALGPLSTDKKTGGWSKTLEATKANEGLKFKMKKISINDAKIKLLSNLKMKKTSATWKGWDQAGREGGRQLTPQTSSPRAAQWTWNGQNNRCWPILDQILFQI